MITVPMITASTRLPPGKIAGACWSSSTEPTATFMPSVFMMRASHMDTSRTRPVALRVKLESCGAPVARAGVDVMRITSWARARPGPGLTGTMGHRRRADDVLELTADAVALQREGEPVSPVQHARHLGRAVVLVEGRALDLERGGARRQLQQRRLVVPELDDLDGGQRPAHLHAVAGARGWRTAGPWRSPARPRSGNRAGSSQAVSRASGPSATEATRSSRNSRRGLAVERVADLRRRRQARRAGHRERGFQALAAQRIGEAAEQADLLDDLVRRGRRCPCPGPGTRSPAAPGRAGPGGPARG